MCGIAPLCGEGAGLLLSEGVPVMSRRDCPLPKAEVPWCATKRDLGCSRAVRRGAGRVGTADGAVVS